MQHPAVGTEFSFGSGSFQILAPAIIDPNDSNKNSVAIKLTNGNNSFIFTGDAESTSEKPCVNPVLTSPAMYWFRDITVLPQLPAGIFSGNRSGICSDQLRKG